MSLILPLGVGLVIAGLLFCWLREKVGSALLSTVVYYTGIVLVVVGLVLILTPVLIWLHAQLTAMLGVR